MLSSFSFFCKQTRIKNGFSIRAFLPLFLFESVAAAAAGGAAAGIAAAALFGFDFERIVPLECSMRAMFEVGGVQFNLCDSLQFSVAGKGWSTDFDTLAEAPQYDEKKGGM